MHEKHLSFDFTARYFQLGEIHGQTKTIWLVLHGQGQLAPYFAQKFEPLIDAATAVVIPEGLSRYYLNGMAGRVGAIWMTREDRLTDIQNYVKYLDALWTSLDTTPEKIVVLGFSQGAATASRWVSMGKVPATHLVLWAGIFPPDLPPIANERLQAVKSILVYGTEDAYLSEERLAEQQAIRSSLNAEVETITYKGGHRIYTEVLLSLPVD